MLEVTMVSTYYPDVYQLNHLGESRFWQPPGSTTVLTIRGSRWSLYHQLGIGDNWMHQFNGWNEVIEYEVRPDEQPCKLGGATVLDKLMELGIVDGAAEAAIKERLNPASCDCEGQC